MFFDKELNQIQAAKQRLATCCELRRALIAIEARGVWRGTHRTLSTLRLSLAVAEQVFGLLREFASGRR